VVFTPESIVISDISDGSQVAVGVADHKFRLYYFSHFIPKSSPTLLQTHGNEVSRLNPLTGKLFIVRSVKFEEGPIHALQEEPIADPPLLVDVVLSDSNHTSDSDQI
jgi:hypothetical protein